MLKYETVINMNYSLEIKNYRKKNELSQRDFAQMIGVKYNTVYRWENGLFEPSNKYKKKLNSILGETLFERKTKYMKRMLSVLICLISIFTISSCGNNNHENEVLVTDMSGAKVWVPKNPKKVAAVSPSTGDLMIAFGLGDVLDGTYYSVMDNPWAEIIYPESASLFGYDYDNSVETFIERGADLIFIPEPATAKNLRDHGLNALCVRQFSEEGYGDYVFAFSEIVRTIWGDKVDEKVDMWQADFNKAVNTVTSKLKENNIYEEKQRTLYYICGDKDRGLGYTDLGKSLLEYVYDLLNIDFICNRFETNRPSAEAVLEINPDIVAIGGIYQQYLLQQIKVEEPWNRIKGVVDGKLYNIPVGFVSFEQTAAESSLFIYDMANKLYPDLFEFDMVSLTKECMSKYFSYELSTEEANNILKGLDRNGEPLIWKE